MSDLPAAHSMDTAWFAVDAEGHVARFHTGEDGAKPTRAAHQGGPIDANFDVDALRQHLHRDKPPGAWFDAYMHDDAMPGLFEYRREHGDDPGRYRLAQAPELPALLSEIPAEPREAIGRFRLPSRFAQTPIVHLADHIPDHAADMWGDGPLRLLKE